MITIIDLKSILDQAFGISNNAKFNVLSYNKENEHNELRELTYLQLGTELISKHSEIKEVHIIYKDVH